MRDYANPHPFRWSNFESSTSAGFIDAVLVVDWVTEAAVQFLRSFHYLANAIDHGRSNKLGPAVQTRPCVQSSLRWRKNDHFFSDSTRCPPSTMACVTALIVTISRWLHAGCDGSEPTTSIRFKSTLLTLNLILLLTQPSFTSRSRPNYKCRP
jgi:hypothetical protein